MKMNPMRLSTLPILGMVLLALLQFSHGQGIAPSPAPIGSTNDGAAIDQGIAYTLLLVALAITYILH